MDYISNINANSASWGVSKVEDKRQVMVHSALDNEAMDKAHTDDQRSAQMKYAMKRLFTKGNQRFTTYDVYTGFSQVGNADQFIKRSHTLNPDSKQKAFQLDNDTLVVANL